MTAAGLRTRPFSPLLGDGNWAVLIQAKLHPRRNLEIPTLRHMAESAVNIYTPVFVRVLFMQCHLFLGPRQVCEPILDIK